MTGKPADLSDILIRDAREDDAPALAKYISRLSKEGPDAISPRLAAGVDNPQAVIARVAGANRSFLLLAIETENIVGALDIWGGPRPQIEHMGKLAMSVARSRRGSAIAGKLVAAALARCRQWPGFCRLQLEIMPRNTEAIQLYSSYGFRLEGRQPKAINLHGEPEDVLLMSLVW